MARVKMSDAERRQIALKVQDSWRCGSINHALRLAKTHKLPLHGLPNVLARNNEHVVVSLSRDGSVSQCNVAKLEELLHSVGFVEGHVLSRQSEARDMARNWNSALHEKFIAHCVAHSVPKSGPVPAPVRDDGISLGEAVSASLGGSW